MCIIGLEKPVVKDGKGYERKGEIEGKRGRAVGRRKGQTSCGPNIVIPHI